MRKKNSPNSNGGRVKNSIRNITYRIIAQIATILLRFISRTVFIYVLGVEYLGINGVFSEILQMLSLADLGFGTAMVFSMYKPLATHDETKLSQLVQLYKKIYTYIAVAISVIGIALMPFLQYIINLDTNIPYIRIYYLLYLANTVSSYLVVYKTCILTADQKSYITSKYNIIFSFLSTIGCIVCLLVTKKFMIYLVTQVFFTYLNNFYLSHVASKMYPYINVKKGKLPTDEAKEIFTNVKSVFIYKTANTLVGSTDNSIISILLGTVVVGYYSNYTMIINNLSLIINIIFSSVTASLGNLIVENNKQKNYSVYQTMQFVSFVISSITLTGVYLLINDFVTIWLGNKYMLDNLVVAAIVINMFFSIVLMPIWSYREATGMYRQTKYVMVATAIVNLILSILLGKWIGLAGILIATSIARISTYFWYEPKLLFKQFFDKNVREYYKSIVINICITLIIVCVCSIIFGNWLVSSWTNFFIKFIILVLFSFVLTLLLYSWNKEEKKLLYIAIQLLKNKRDN
ncbi:transporter [Erysipelatoclostridium sp. An173]|uniref:lipopolysaccharide biosynthesis protein n=1 Tax=Erysipelatoclostridium sp. An173 TaxID=1965571 RepID=UPI000B393D92|nr:lipopolysaccharide biosynthesis protein [Erysipelatoclostridium sp. An173]OUP72889.1 transporter [Erysipelatoclostridium sp. An173]